MRWQCVCHVWGGEELHVRCGGKLGETEKITEERGIEGFTIL